MLGYCGPRALHLSEMRAPVFCTGLLCTYMETLHSPFLKLGRSFGDTAPSPARAALLARLFSIGEVTPPFFLFIFVLFHG